MDKRFDETRIMHEIEHFSYKVEYYVYKDGEKYSAWFTEENIKNKKFKKNAVTCCFSQLRQMLNDFSKEHKEWPNRLLFLCNFKNHGLSKYHTTLEEIRWWITTCKKHKLLPNYINNEFAKTGNLILKIDVLDLNTLYIYLTAARYLQEEPYFVKAIKYLVVDEHIDFYTAFAIASRCCICNTGHHIIPVGKKYPFFNQHNNINSIDTYDLSDAFKLKHFLSEEESANRIPVKKVKIGQLTRGFNLHRALDDIGMKKVVIKRKDLISKNMNRKVN